MGQSEVELERLGLVPAEVRAFVIDRDGSCCRVCGRHVETPALHHVRYRSQGGLDVPSNLVTVGWLPGHDCHLDVVHRDKRTWQPLLLRLLEQPNAGLTARQLMRWERNSARPGRGRAL